MAMTPEELDFWSGIRRQERDRILTNCDWTMCSDAHVDKNVWATFRQAMRDVPQQPGFPETFSWPEPPVDDYRYRPLPEI